MKRISYLLLIIFLLGTIISCDDDAFLEENPKTIYTPESAFTTSKQVDDQLVTAYLALAGTYTDTWWLGLGADNYDVEDYQCSFGAGGESNYATWTTNDFSDQWNTLYQIASYANLAMSGAELVTWSSEDDKASELAQAKFLRGWAYLRLGELFGGVPIVEEYSEELKLDYTRSTRAETYQFAIDNFEDAVAGLPESADESGRISVSVAKHFLAEAYLALGTETDNAGGEFAQAISYASDVVAEHDIMHDRFGVRADATDGGSQNGAPNYRADGDVFYDLFRKGNYDASENTESVWVAKSADYDGFMEYFTEQGWFGPNSDAPLWSIGANAAPVFRDLYWADDYVEDGAGLCPWTGNVDQTLYSGGSTGYYCGGFSIARFAPTSYLTHKVWGGDSSNELWDDMRNSELNYSRIHICLDQDHSLYGQPITEDMIVQRGDGFNQFFPMTAKVFNREDLWGFDSYTLSTGGGTIYGRDIYLVRSAETYLLRAEAYLRSGQSTEAANDINTLRTRANCAKLYTGSEVDIYTILDERIRELSYEEQRWATLLRIGGDELKNQLMDNAMYVADAPTPIFTGTIDWDLLPIPEDAFISINTGAEIEQNPGW